MISSIELNNFLSHEVTKVNFGEDRTIGVIGENGHGKSALLEAIAYAHYGVGRDTTIQGLSRNNGDGGHSVTVRHKDTPRTGDELVVERGCNPSGNGFSAVYWNGERVAKGKGTTQKIEDLFGQDAPMFFLTSFFGLSIAGYSDTVVRVVPAQRLETLQKIANVYIYSKMHERVTKRRKSLETQKERKESEIGALEEVVESKSELESQLKTAKSDLKRLNEKIQKLRTELKEVSEEEQRFIALANERDSVSEQLGKVREDLDEVESDYEENQSRQSELKEEVDELISNRDEVQSELESVDVQEMREAVDRLSREQERHQTEKNLKSVATEVDDATSCPLCGSPIDHTVVEKWSQDIKSLDGEITRLSTELKSKNKTLSDVEKKSEKVETYKNNLSALFSEADQLKKDSERLDKRRSELRSEKKKQEDRYAEIERSLGEEYEEVRTRRTNLDSEIESHQTKIGSTNERISTLDQRIEKSKTDRKKIRDKKKEVDSLNVDLEASKVVENAFSRYGIPNALLQRLKDAISRKATEIYSEFDSGEILVKDVEERGKPGVEFVLSDRKGNRRYQQLSNGEYAMFYLSIRVAISKILESSKDMRVDFLVLDELTANMSPKNAAALMSLVGKVLRKMYPQTFLVSHVKLPEVFDRQVLCLAENDVSEVHEV